MSRLPLKTSITDATAPSILDAENNALANGREKTRIRENSRGRRSDSKDRRSASASKGRRISRNRSGGSRHGTKKNSAIRSSSHSVRSSSGSLELLDVEDGDAKGRRSRVPPMRGKGSTSHRSFCANAEDTKPRANDSEAKRGGIIDLANPSGKSQAPSAEILYGDEDFKGKAKASRGSKRSLKPGAELIRVSGHNKSSGGTARSTALLYGDEDSKAKAKASRLPKIPSKPGVDLVRELVKTGANIGSDQTIETLYGISDKDSKAKSKVAQGSSHRSKGSLGSSSHHSNRRSTIKTLYGNDLDAKTKMKRSHSSRSIKAGKRVAEETESSESRSSSDMPPPAEDYVAGDMAIEDDSHSVMAENSVVESDKSNEASKKQKSQKKKKPSKKMWITLAFITLVVGGGMTAFIALKGDDDQGAQAKDAVTQDPSADILTAPNGSPNGTSTASPSEKPLLDPPSAEDCAAITNNQTIADNNTLSQSDWNINIQISVKGETGMTDEMIQELLDSIQELLLPSMAGCNNGDQRKLFELRKAVIRGASRELKRFLYEARYAILYAHVKGELLEDVGCVDTTTPELCYVVLVEFSILLDADITSADLEAIILEELENGDNIVSKLDLHASFLSVNARNITDVTPTEASSSPPTSASSRSSSKSPTKSPTVQSPTKVPDSPTSVPVPPPIPVSGTPTSMPVDEHTLAPIPSPSEVQRDDPSISPSTMLSMSPSTAPSSMPPTAFPTALTSSSPSTTPLSAPPVPSPTMEPSVSATAFYSSAPSMMPPAAPEPLSTPRPTMNLTVSPTALASIAPSAKPSVAPVPLPTPGPTIEPTMTTTNPSAVPSRTSTARPTPVQSPGPTPNPTVTPATFCCSENLKDCDITSPWCNSSEQRCNSCDGHYIVQGSCPATGIAKWEECTNHVNHCCARLQCVVQAPSYRQCE
ncbi:unnamed protein product [Cylindrotheca closterium]|uniref:Uncharacterized protein n=1 Tax=Cylindrotheca closterium TaxID=2856 RepID=A0AAD2JN65_9STRA|nr:unnamed protein product [Cylindrotheca closterium]